VDAEKILGFFFRARIGDRGNVGQMENKYSIQVAQVPITKLCAKTREALEKYKFSELHAFKERTAMRNIWHMKTVDLR
jgi:hypothetical protein